MRGSNLVQMELFSIYDMCLGNYTTLVLSIEGLQALVLSFEGALFLSIEGRGPTVEAALDVDGSGMA